MRAGWLILALAAAAPGAAQVTCRQNALGSEICTGLPAPTLRGRDPFAPPRDRGLGAVQPPPIESQVLPRLRPERAVDILGTIILGPQDLPPRRAPLPGIAPPRDCARDALGNLVCN